MNQRVVAIVMGILLVPALAMAQRGGGGHVGGFGGHAMGGGGFGGHAMGGAPVGGAAMGRGIGTPAMGQGVGAPMGMPRAGGGFSPGTVVVPNRGGFAHGGPFIGRNGERFERGERFKHGFRGPTVVSPFIYPYYSYYPYYDYDSCYYSDPRSCPGYYDNSNGYNAYEGSAVDQYGNPIGAGGSPGVIVVGPEGYHPPQNPAYPSDAAGYPPQPSPSAQEAPAPRGPYVMLAFKSRAFYGTSKYWLTGNNICFIPDSGGQICALLDTLDVAMTRKLNPGANLNFTTAAEK